MRLSRILRMVCAGAILAAAAAAALAEPPGEPDINATYAETMEAFYAEQDRQMDQMFASAGPITYDPATLAIYTRYDERFQELADRLTVRYLADPQVRKSYEKQVSRGWFAGSAEAFARRRTVDWLNEPQYGYNAAIQSPNLSNGQLIIDAWRVSSTRGPLANEAPCTNEWTARKPIPELAADFERAVNGYLQWAYAVEGVMTAFNPDGINFIDAAGEREFLWAAISAWLVSNDETLLQAPVCAKTFTNFDSWAKLDEKMSTAVDRFPADMRRSK